MSVFGYIFSDQSTVHAVPIGEQQKKILMYSQELGAIVENFIIEEGSSVKKPFRQRNEGGKLMKSIKPGDIIITMKAEWVLGSAKEGLRLVNILFNNAVSLYIVDLQENISLPTERKLLVSEGNAVLVRKLLEALSVCESSKHGESIKAAKEKMRKEGKYLGGPVPFGWKVENGYLEKDVEQQGVIREVQRLRSERWSYRDIVGKLKEKFGIQLSHEGIRRIVLSTEDRS